MNKDVGFFHWFKIGFFMIFWFPYAIKLYNQVEQKDSQNYKKKMKEDIYESAVLNEEDVSNFLKNLQ